MGNAQQSNDGYSQEFWDWWEGVWADYMAKKRAWEMGYLQDWNENMQKGIKRLNTMPQQVGVTPINGALLFNETDISIPGRLGNISVTRFYNGKIWYSDTSQTKDYCAPFFWLGMGWDMHFGRYYNPDNDAGLIFETPQGNRTYFCYSDNGVYTSTDGSFKIFRNDTLRTSNGEILIFENNSNTYFVHDYDNMEKITHVYNVKKIIDRNGNYTTFYYCNTMCSYRETQLYPLDSLITSTNEKIQFHYHHTISGNWDCLLLDSITYTGFDAESLTIIYHYYDLDSTTISPWGRNYYSGIDNSFYDYTATCLLKSVVYPNGDSVYYEYNDDFELTGIHTTGGGLVSYEIKTDSFYIPDAQIFPPDDSALLLLQLTRGIKKVKSYDPWTAPDTNIIEFKRFFTESPANQAVSNADSVVILDPEGNYELLMFRASRAPDRAEATQWIWDNGLLINRRYYDKNRTLLQKMESETELITEDNIPVIKWLKVNNGAKTYRTEYGDYDDYGNACSIHVYGDTSITTDDYWIHREYVSGITSLLRLQFHEGLSTFNAIITFSSLEGIDSLKVKRGWWGGNTSAESCTTIHYVSPCYQESTLFQLKPYPDDDSLAKITAWAWYSGCSLKVWSDTIHLLDDPPELDTTSRSAHCWDAAYGYGNKYLVHLVKEELISDGASDTLNMTQYFYDDTSYIVTTYSPDPDQWESLSDVRGNLTRVEQWKGGSNYTKSELRYDQVGNVVMAISYSDANTPETTFTYYNSTYQYAYPWLSVTHLASGDSLCARTEYDLHTGLVTRSIDESNADSTRYEYDNTNRLKKVYYPNKTSASKRITYKDDASPEAVIDSTRLDNRWMISKSFFDGFGRLIQTKTIDENDSTIVQNISYNSIGLKDSVCNPYRIYGTSLNYSSPSWSQITTYKYDALGRDTLITHPDQEKVSVKYYANTDTVYDEKGNKTIHIYNAFGALDMVINALNDTTLYEYDHLGRLTKVTDAEENETEYYYDELGRLTGVNGPDAKSPAVDVLYEYDDLGNLTRKKDANGWVDYTYDNINRLTRVELSTNQGSTWNDKVQFTYDQAFSAPTPDSLYNNPKGRLGKMVTNNIDSILCFYDDKGNLTLKRVGIVGLQGPKQIKYKYNEAQICTTLWVTGIGYLAKYQYNRLARLTGITNLVNSFKYNPAGQITKIDHGHHVIDTITYDNRLRPTYIKSYNNGPVGDNYLKLAYTYEKNSNVASITDSLISSNTQTFAYDSLNRLTTVTSSIGNQSFTYDRVGNRMSKNGTNYTYYDYTNQLQQDHRGFTYNYDDNGNITSRSDGTNYQYDWNNRLVEYTKGTEEIEFAYNASGLRVKKYYHIGEDPKGSGEFGSLFLDASNDLGIKSRGPDSIYNKGRDIEKVHIKNSPQYLDFTLIHRHIFNEPGRLNLFITLDVDTMENSGRLTLPEDTMTKVSKKCAWEYCIYVNDYDYGYYNQNNSKISKPFGMLVVKTPGPSGIIKVKISKQLINNPQAIRYTIATFAPSQPPNFDTLFQGGSSAVDVFPGTKETFGGEINGYGESTPLGDGMTSNYTIYYVYSGINPIVEYASNGSILARYIYAGGRHIAKIAGADTHYYHCDALGSPRKMTDERSSTVWSATYYPFGEMTAGSNNTHGFTGKEFDSEMGLNYFCQRYYDPEIGRFTTLDPQNSPTASPYAYCANCPLVFIDPTGAVMHVCTKLQDLADNTSGGASVPYWGAIHSWALMDPGLFGGPAHDIVSFGSGFYHWDYETGTWTGYGEPFTSPAAFANTLSDLMGGYITAYGEPWYKGDTPLTQGDIKAALGWLENNIPVFKDIRGLYNFAFSLRNVSAIWTEKQYGGALYRVFVYEYLARECLPRSLGHELYEVHLINSMGYKWGNPAGPAHYETVNQMRNWFNYNSWYPFF